MLGLTLWGKLKSGTVQKSETRKAFLTQKSSPREILDNQYDSSPRFEARDCLHIKPNLIKCIKKILLNGVLG